MYANVSEYRTALVNAFHVRASYEAAKNAENDNIQRTLADMIKSVDNDHVAEVFYAANVNANFINRSERVSARFNVYSAEKVINIARASVSAESLNHYTRAILATLATLNKNDAKMTHRDAECACSLSVKASDAKRDKMITRYQKHISVKTAATQSSSSINALQMFDVIRESRDAANNVVYSLNVRNRTTLALLRAIRN